MTFATPSIALIAAAVAIPALIILYFLKLRRRDMEVSSTMLWKKAVQDLQANAPFQKLRNNILLILQLLVLLGALFALAQPELRDQGVLQQRHILLIDRSASMQATDGNPGSDKAMSRLDAAKDRAKEIVQGLRERTLLNDSSEEAMVIAFDSTAQLVQPFTGNKAQLLAAIDGIAPTDAPTSLERAYELARSSTGTRKFEDQVKEGPSRDKPLGFVPSGPSAAIHIISDGRLPDASKVQTAPEDVVLYHPVGTDKAMNVGLVGLSAERAFDDPTRVNVFVQVQSTDPSPRKVGVDITIDGVITRVDDVSVTGATQAVGVEATTDPSDGPSLEIPRAKPGLGGFVMPLRRPGPGQATVRIRPNGPDVLDTDNVAYLNIPPARRLSVVLVTRGNAAAQRALERQPFSAFEIKTPEEFQRMLDAGETARYDVYILDRWLPEVTASSGPSASAGATARQPGLPPGRSLVFGVIPPPPLGVQDNGPADAAVMVDFERDHPVMSLSGLDKVSLFKSRKVTVLPDTPVRVLARDTTGPSILEITDATTQAMVVIFNPLETNWFITQGWVMFLGAAPMYLAQIQSGTLSEGFKTGTTVATRLPSGAKDIAIELPSGTRVNQELAPDDTVAFAPASSSGFYTVLWTGQATASDREDGSRVRRPIAVNLLDPFESDIGTIRTLAMARKEDIQGQTSEGDLTRRLWPWLLLGALGIILLEWYVYNRKVAL